MTQELQHPITPPLELLREWCRSSREHEDLEQFWRYIATQAAQWGADQQLDTCCKSLDDIPGGWGDSRHLRHVCRPKPPSTKERALEVVTGLEKRCDLQCDLACIRLALEALND